MTKTEGWWQAPGKLLILFLLVVLPPSATLVVLGVRLLEQDRALAHQRQTEILERTSDLGVRALEHDLAVLAKKLAAQSWEEGDFPEDLVLVSFSREQILASPSGRLPYFPTVPPFPEPPAQIFTKLESQEYAHNNLEEGLEIARKLSAAADIPLRAGALVRQARLLRKLNRPDEALAVYRRLGEIRSVCIDGTPVDLAARKARCSMLAEMSRHAELLHEASSIDSDLRSGKWPLDQATYEQVVERLSRWLNADVRSDGERQALAEGVDWLYRRWTGGAHNFAAAQGRELIEAGGKTLTILWTSHESGVAALVAGPEYARTEWLHALQQAAQPARACLLAASGKPVAGDPPADGERRVVRPAADTGLPWTVVVAGAEETNGALAARRRSLLAGLIAVLMLVVAGSYFIWHAVNREMAAARLQSDFVSAVSHEFRTPLTTLRQFSELLAEDEELPRKTQRRYHAGQVRAVGRLQRLVEALLDFGRMEGGRRPYRLEPMEAGALVRAVTDEFRSEVAERGFTVECSLDAGAAMVQGDAEALGRALYNLLDNAAKYSGDSPGIEVTLRRAQDSVSLGVRDHGVGIPADEKRRIFQKFVRGSAAKSQGIQGTGIGLAIVRHIVRAHGGSVSVQSTPGAGSAFTIVLPAKE
jgi:two-component system phosphate regulon sensor histidine kinase PhoR